MNLNLTRDNIVATKQHFFKSRGAVDNPVEPPRPLTYLTRAQKFKFTCHLRLVRFCGNALGMWELTDVRPSISMHDLGLTPVAMARHGSGYEDFSDK
jgi:hypothetical protein